MINEDELMYRGDLLLQYLVINEPQDFMEWADEYYTEEELDLIFRGIKAMKEEIVEALENEENN